MPDMTEEQRKQLEEKIKKMSPEELRDFQKQQCIFCQIASGKVPAKKIYEDQECLAILDINPAAKGHLLLLPKEHYAIMPQLPDKTMQHLFVVSKNLSKLLLRTLKVEGTTLFIANGLVAGQKAQHFMIHLIPRKEGDGLFTQEEKFLPEEVRNQVHQAVQNALYPLLGLKKEVVVQPEEKEAPAGEKGLEEEEPSPEPPASEEESASEAASEPPAPQKKSSEKKKSPKKEAEPEPETAPKKEGVSLDDIANLFK